MYYCRLMNQALTLTARMEFLLPPGEACRVDRGFDSRWCNWNFSLTLSFRPHCGPGVDSTSNRSEYKEYFLEGNVGRCVGLTTFPPLCADCLQIWEPQPSGTLGACPVCNGTAFILSDLFCVTSCWSQFFTCSTYYAGMRRITTFRSTTDRIYNGGPIILKYNIIIPLCYNSLQYSVQ